MTITQDELRKRKTRFVERSGQYLGLGHDRFAAAAFVAEGAGGGPGKALDVGTGKGLLAMALARRGFDVTSVDVDEEEQALAALMAEEAGLSERIVFRKADAADLPFADGHFDVVASMDALHHFADGGPILRELARVAKGGGLLVLGEFTEEGFSLVERVHAAEGASHARSQVTLDWFSGFLAGRGFFLEERAEAHLQDRRIFRAPSEAAARPDDAGQPSSAFDSMSRSELGGALEAFAKNWLAHDGCWFLAAEERFGMEAAMELDAASWGRFAAAEAARIRETFGLGASGGLRALERALSLRMYALLNRQRVEWHEGGKVLRFVMEACRVQEARKRKGLPPFPCRPVGEVEFSTFARTLDPAVEVRCVSCPPDPNEWGACTWEFTLRRARGGGEAGE